MLGMSPSLNPAGASTMQRPSGRMGSIVWIIVLSLFTAGSLVAFYELASDQAISIMVVGVIFFILMWFVMSSASSAELRSRNLVFALWWGLLGVEEVFP